MPPPPTIPPRLGTRALLGRLWRLLAGYRRLFYASAACMVLAGAIEPLLPWLLGALLDSSGAAIDHPLPPHLLPWAFLAVIMMRSLLGFARGYLTGWLETTVQRDLRRTASHNLLHWRPAALAAGNSGDITSHITFLTGGVIGGFMGIVITLVQSGIKLVGYAALLLYLHWPLAVIVLVFFVPVALLTRAVNHRISRKSQEILAETIASVSCINQLVDGWKVVKTYAGQQAEMGRLGRIFQRIRNDLMRRVLAQSLLLPVNQLLLAAPLVYIIYYVVNGLADGTLTPGTVAAFISTLLLLNGPVRGVIGTLTGWAEFSVTAQSLFNFLEKPLETDSGTRTLADPRGEISYDNVSFTYPVRPTGEESSAASADATSPAAGESKDAGTSTAADADAANAPPAALADITLNIAAGETVALVGRSGAGKTTLVGLLPRFFSPQRGRIRIDGADIADFTLKSLRRHIDIVTQEPFLFDDTIAANIAYPDSAASPARLQRALQNAAAADFVARLPQGAETRIGEKGSTLSGGQRQRLVLARAFYRNAPILILDEATSSLDSSTERHIQQALRRLLAGRTVIIIAHRFSTVHLADRIVLLEDGRLAAAGTLQHLLATCPAFATLYRAQSLENAENAPENAEKPAKNSRENTPSNAAP